jgi:putative molybdopterin biosynthesis protein
MIDDCTLTPIEVAEILKITKNTVYELVKRGELNGYKVGSKLRIDMKDVEEYKKNSKNNKSQNNHMDTNQRTPINTAYNGGFIITGQDIMLDILVRHIERNFKGFHPLRSYEGSYNGLYALYNEKVQVATSHLWDGDTGEYNVPYVKRMLPGVPAVIVHLAKRMQGFYIGKGNPKNIKGWEDLKRFDISIINREKGSGTRVLLDEQLRLRGINPSSINGYDKECSSHLGIASTVARGEADIGLGNEKSGLQVTDIEFIPLQQERYEMIIKKEDFHKPNFQVIMKIINSEEFKRDIEGIGGYDLTDMGKVVGET